MSELELHLQVQPESQHQVMQDKLWGSNPVAVLAALWVAVMVFLAVCDDVAAKPIAPSISERSERHEMRLEYYLSGAEIISNQTNQYHALSASSSVDDIRLSESVAPSRFWQTNPSACILNDGSIVVAFEDDRQGSKKIFLQKYNSAGNAIGANLMIAGRSDGFDLIEPQVVATVSNKMYLAYRDIAAGDIRVVRLNSDLSVDLADFVASDNDASVYAGPFAIASRDNGDFAIVYESYSSVNTIALRRFGPTGSLVSSSGAVNSDGTSASHWVPDLAFDENGGLGVVWEDYRSGVADIFLRRYDSVGSDLGVEINLIDADAQSVGQFMPSLVFSDIHGFLAGWSDSRFLWTVYLQRYSKQIGLVGANLPITALDSLTAYLDVQLAVSDNGLLTAIYCGYGASSDALAQHFDASLVPVSVPLVLATEILDQPASPALARDGHHALVWELRSGGDKDILLTVTNSSLSPLNVEPVKVSDDALGAISDQPEVSVVDGWSVVTVFRDLRRDAGDIFVQGSQLDGALRNVNLLVNEDNAGGLQSEPSISANSAGYIVAWQDERFVDGVNSSRIYVRYGNPTDGLTSSELLVSDDDPTLSIGAKATPSVALAPDGSALVAWFDTRNGTPHIYARLLDASGAVVGDAFRVSSPGNGNGHTSPVVSVDDNGNFTVCWINTAASGGAVINAKRYASDKTFLGSFSFASDVSDVSITDFDADVDGAGNVFLLWSGVDGASGASLFLTALSASGAKVDVTQEIPDNVNASPVEPTVSVDEFANILMAWVDSRGPERRIYTQNHNADLTPAGGNQPLSLAGAPAMSSPSALSVRGRSWVGWVDARSEGLNVYLRGYVHFATDVGDDDASVLPSDFALAQNYPNPFNPSTKISFTLAHRTKVTLTVYNVLGQSISQLAQGDFAAGSHQVLWDGTDGHGSTVASGVYFYRLKSAEFTQTRKMTLLK